MFPILNPPPTSLPIPSLWVISVHQPLYHASNPDWWFISHMIFYMFQCHSLISSHPRLLPQSPKDCSLLLSCIRGLPYIYIWDFPIAQMVKNLLAMQETWVQSLGQEDPLEEKMAIHSSILAWRIPWTEEPGGLQSMGSQKARHD